MDERVLKKQMQRNIESKRKKSSHCSRRHQHGVVLSESHIPPNLTLGMAGTAAGVPESWFESGQQLVERLKVIQEAKEEF
jgi:hypothetical protein